VREVDYCSGASLMVRRALFAELGGFDPHYAPAYYEDADLAFRLRARGHVTLYQPRSEVVQSRAPRTAPTSSAGSRRTRR